MASARGSAFAWHPRSPRAVLCAASELGPSGIPSFGPFSRLRVASALRGVCARPGRGLKPVCGRGTVFLQDYGLVVFLLVRLLHSVLAQLEFDLMAQLFRYENAFAFGCNMVQHSDNASFLIMSCICDTGTLSSRRKHCFRGGVVRF